MILCRNPVLATAFILAFAFAAPFGASAPARAAEQVVVVEEGPTTPLSIVTATGVYPFAVEIADDPQERAQGLMFRSSMAEDHGMLFDMDRTAEAAFWMENTEIPLDIIFIGANGTVVSVAERAEPYSRDIISSKGAIRFVLELNGGEAAKIGLKPGDRVKHALIDKVAGR